MLNDAEIKETYGDYTSNNRGPALKNAYHGERHEKGLEKYYREYTNLIYRYIMLL